MSDPKETWKEWIHQKMRHFSSGKLYKFSDRAILGLYLAAKFVLYCLLIFFILTRNLNAASVSGLLLYIMVITVVNFCLEKFFALNTRWPFSVFYDFLYSVSTVTLGIGSFLKSDKWK
jgi:hypothetical protein